MGRESWRRAGVLLQTHASPEVDRCRTSGRCSSDTEAARRAHLVLAAAILLVAAILRLAWLATIPAGLSHDEVVKGYDAWSVLHTSRDEYDQCFPLVFRRFGD